MSRLLLFLILNLIQSKDITFALNELKQKYPQQLQNINELGITVINTDACTNCSISKLISHLEKISFFEKEKTILLIPTKRKIELEKYIDEELGISKELQERLIIISDSKIISCFKDNMTDNGGSIFYLSFKNNDLQLTVPFDKLGKAEYYKKSKERKIHFVK